MNYKYLGLSGFQSKHLVLIFKLYTYIHCFYIKHKTFRLKINVITLTKQKILCKSRQFYN